SKIPSLWQTATPLLAPIGHVFLSWLGALAATGLTVAWHRRWEMAEDGTPVRGLLDGLCHTGTALAVALPVLPYVRDPRAFLRVTLTCALAIDLDHVPAARSLRLTRCMGMERRPP